MDVALTWTSSVSEPLEIDLATNRSSFPSWEGLTENAELSWEYVTSHLTSFSCVYVGL